MNTDWLGSPWLSALVIAGLMAFAYLILWFADSRTERRKYGSSAKEARHLRAKRSRTRAHLPAVLLLGAVACLLVAFGQFQTRTERAEAVIVLTMDVSQSMNQQDVEPNRLEAAKVAAATFLEQIPDGFRVGLVTFAGESTVLVPPTDEHTAVELALAELPRGRGTLIGDGLASSLAEIENDWGANGTEPAAIVLLSDGRDTGSETPPEDAAEDALAMRIPIYTVVLGVEEGDAAANTALLESLASTTNGTSTTAATAEELDSVFEALGTELSTTLSIGGTGPAFVVLGALLAGAAGAIVVWSSRREKPATDKRRPQTRTATRSR